MWETALRLARRETDNNVKHKHNRAKRDTSSIKSRVVYVEHCARWGALSKANQAVTSNALPNADPNNINVLRGKHPDPAHPGTDPVRVSSILWPRPKALEDHVRSKYQTQTLRGESVRGSCVRLGGACRQRGASVA